MRPPELLRCLAEVLDLGENGGPPLGRKRLEVDGIHVSTVVEDIEGCDRRLTLLLSAEDKVNPRRQVLARMRALQCLPNLGYEGGIRLGLDGVGLETRLENAQQRCVPSSSGVNDRCAGVNDRCARVNDQCSGVNDRCAGVNGHPQA